MDKANANKTIQYKIMKLSEVKSALVSLDAVNFELPNGELVPSHFHVTEVGQITKHFIDCGGTVRNEKVVNFQLWNANDYDHRLHPNKLLEIITLSEKILGIEDLEIEVEYQGETIQKFGLHFHNDRFVLTSKQTDCLAKDKCEIPINKQKFQLPSFDDPCCSPNSDCC